MFDQEFVNQLAEKTAAIVLKALDRPNVQKAYFTVQEASVYTSYTVEALRACIKKKLFPTTGHGTTLRISKKVLDDWMESETT